MAIAAIEGLQVAFFVEDAHMAAAPECLEVLNGLLAAGEAPGLFGQDELEPLLAKIKAEASSEGFRGGAMAYFSTSQSLVNTIHYYCAILDNLNQFLILKKVLNQLIINFTLLHSLAFLTTLAFIHKLAFINSLAFIETLAFK